MKVRDVLKLKGDRMFIIEPEATMPRAVATLVENNIGSLPVVDRDGQLVGVISERDLIRELHDRGEQFTQTQVSAVMTLDPVVCDIDDDVEEVMGLMSDRRIAKVPVIERGHLAGIVSVGDVIKTLYSRTKEENLHLMDYLYGPAHV